MGGEINLDVLFAIKEFILLLFGILAIKVQNPFILQLPRGEIKCVLSGQLILLRCTLEHLGFKNLNVH